MGRPRQNHPVDLLLLQWREWQQHTKAEPADWVKSNTPREQSLGNDEVMQILDKVIAQWKRQPANREHWRLIRYCYLGEEERSAGMYAIEVLKLTKKSGFNRLYAALNSLHVALKDALAERSVARKP